MPRFDGTGPIGMGPMTGRGLGPCGWGLGWRRRFGSRRGLGRYVGGIWPQTKQDKLEALKEYKVALTEELEDLEEAIKDVESEK